MNRYKFFARKNSGSRLIGVGLRIGFALIAFVGLATTGYAVGTTLGDAVDATSLTWTTGGNANWFYQTATTHDGSDAAQSGDIGDDQSSWIQTTVTGPGTLLFWWKVSSEDAADYLRFTVDGSEISSVVAISGELAWTQKSVLISNGLHTLKWQYSKDGSSTDGSDCGWVDQIIWSSVPYYTVSASASPVDWGSTTGAGSYISNSVCTVTAQASTGFKFTNWLEGTNVLTTATNYTFTVTSNRTFVAKFTPMSYTVDTSSSPTVGGTTSGDGSYVFNSSCTVIATPTTGYTFVNWTENGLEASLSSNYTFTVSNSRTLVANFTLEGYTIDTRSSPFVGGVTSGGGTKIFGSSCTVIATPSEGYTFADWTEGISTVSISSNYTFTVEGDRTLVANFTPANYTISTRSSPSVGGTTSGGGLKAYNSSCTVVATTNIGYAFSSWTIGDSVVSTSPSYTFSVMGNAMLVANFTDAGRLGEAVDMPGLTWTTGGASPWFFQTTTTHDGFDAAQSTNQAVSGAKSWIQTTVIGPGSLSFWCKVLPAGTDKDTLSFYDNSVSKIAVENDSGWTNFSYFVPSGNHDLKWEFHNQNDPAPGYAWLDQVLWVPFAFTVSTSSSPLGGGITSGGGVFPSNATCTVTAAANTGYTFANWTAGSTVLTSLTNYTFAVVSNRTLVANFSPNNYTIATSSSPAAGGTTSGGGLKAYDSSCTVVATPNPGYAFVNWTESTNTVGTSTNFTFTVSGARTLVANFTPDNFTITTSASPTVGGTTSGGGQKAYGTLCTVFATPNPGFSFVNWKEGSLVVTATTNYMFVVTTNRTLVANFVFSGTLGDAVDAPELVWTTGGNAHWIPQTATTHDGVDAAHSGTIREAEVSWMQTTVTGPGTLSFWWKVSSEPGFDYLKFYIDGAEQSGAISGEVNWQQKTYSLSDGSHTLKWAYSKDEIGGDLGSDRGWVDQVVWAGGSSTNLLPVYRFWSPVFSGHFFTMNETEKNNIISGLSAYWTYEGVAWYAYPAQVAGTLPVYRFWSPVFAGHFYTMNETEKNNIIAGLSAYWTYEGIAWYAYPTPVAGTVPVYRFWSPVFAHHFFTTNEVEKNNIIAGLSAYWTYEGIAYYAFTSASRDALAKASVPEPSEDLTAKKLEVSQTSSLVSETAVVVTSVEVEGNGMTGIQKETIPDVGDVVFPLSYPGREVAAYVYDACADQLTSILSPTNSPDSATFTGILPDRSYRLEVFADDPVSGEMVRAHRSWFESSRDVPATITETVEADSVESHDGVGSPAMQIKTPDVEGTLTLKLYSASQGVVQTLTEVSGGETVAFSLSEWNRWYWVGGWCDADDELVLSIWLRHETGE